jgi:hypothetical protein
MEVEDVSLSVPKAGMFLTFGVTLLILLLLAIPPSDCFCTFSILGFAIDFHWFLEKQISISQTS